MITVDGTGLALLRAGARAGVVAGRQPHYRPEWRGERDHGRGRQHFVPVAAGAGASWSPDGTRIAYHTSNPDCACDEGLIWVQPVAGGPAVLLGNGNEPDWSADGTQIVYVSYAEYGRHHVLQVMNASDGSHVRTLDAGYAIYAPSWKPVP